MTMFRRMNPLELYNFLNIDSAPVVDTMGPYFGIRECENKTGLVGYPYQIFTASTDTILHPGIPDSVKDLLCSALREFMLLMGRDRKSLELLCIKDDLRSRRAKGCVDNKVLYRSLFMCPVDCMDDFQLSEDLKEIVYHDYV